MNRVRQETAESFDQFTYGERFAFDLVETDGVNEVTASNQHSQLSTIQLRNHDLIVPPKDFPKVCWKRVQPAEMTVSHLRTLSAELSACGCACSVGTPPTQNQQISRFRSIDLGVANQFCNIRDFLSPGVRHVLVVVGIITHVARPILFFKSSNTVHQIGRSGNGPRAGQKVVALIRKERLINFIT